MLSSCFKKNMEKKQITSYFPFSVIKSPNIIDPNYTESTYEYYLLENLSDTLVKESNQAYYSYDPSIATSWLQLNSKTWQFQLRNDLKYSDGTNISKEEYIKLLKQLIFQRNSMHRYYLNNVEKFEISNELKLTIYFKVDTNILLLHELSLADSGLVDYNPSLNSYKKTLGPYFIQSYNEQDKEIILLKNNHYNHKYKKCPDEVKLVGYKDNKLDINMFKQKTFDLYYRTPYLNENIWKDIKSNFSNEVLSQETVITYFYFNPKSDVFRDKSNRIRFKNIVNESIKKNLNLNKKFENQIIPFGYEGRLNQVKLNNESKLNNNKISIKIKLPTPSLNNENFKNTLNQISKNANIQVIYTENDDYDVSTTMIQGNQKMAVTTLRFILNHKLMDYSNELSKLFSDIYESKNEKSINENVKILHSYLLNEAIIVPAIHEPNSVALSNNVNVKNWNRLDMRLRFYEIE